MTDHMIQQKDQTKKQMHNTLMIAVLHFDISQINEHKLDNKINLYDMKSSITKKLRQGVDEFSHL